MKVFVTGAAGFIGSFLCRDLLARGIEVTAFAMPGENIQPLKDRGIAVRVGDLTDAKSLKGCCNGMDIIFHLAARVRDWGPRQAFYAATYDTTQNLLEEAAGKVSRFVYVSSIAACGLGRHLKGHKESDSCFKSGVPYNDSKLDTEALIRDFASKKDLMFTIIRPANVIGPGSVWVWDILDHLRTLMSVPLMDGGRYSASLVYVENLHGRHRESGNGRCGERADLPVPGRLECDMEAIPHRSWRDDRQKARAACSLSVGMVGRHCHGGCPYTAGNPFSCDTSGRKCSGPG